MRITTAFAGAAVLVLSGCVNPYVKYYHSYTREKDPSGRSSFRPCGDDPKIVRSADFVKDGKELIRQGFRPVGYSSFPGPVPHMTDSNALKAAESFSACRVLVASDDVPADQAAAVFYIKIKSVLGVVPQPVPEKIAQKFRKSVGVFAAIVIRGSPADNAGVREGDVLLSVDETLVDMHNFFDTIKASEGRTAELGIYRNGKIIKKPVTLDIEFPAAE